MANSGKRVFWWAWALVTAAVVVLAWKFMSEPHF